MGDLLIPYSCTAWLSNRDRDRVRYSSVGTFGYYRHIARVIVRLSFYILRSTLSVDFIISMKVHMEVI